MLRPTDNSVSCKPLVLFLTWSVLTALQKYTAGMTSAWVAQSAVWLVLKNNHPKFIQLLCHCFQSLSYVSIFFFSLYGLHLPPGLFHIPSNRSFPSVSVWTFLHFGCSLSMLRVCFYNVSTTHVCWSCSLGVKGQMLFEMDTVTPFKAEMASNSKTTELHGSTLCLSLLGPL